jgi:uncharacterized protein YeaO (DUF488 family)
MIRIKRIYELPADGDGLRVLVDRIWPRGMKREAAKVDLWLKEIAPSSALRKWFGHDPAKWGKFCERYYKELESKQHELNVLRSHSEGSVVTLLFSARDAEHNNAIALKAYLELSRKK